MVDGDGASINGPAMQSSDGRFSSICRGHLDECEALGATRFTVRHDLGGGNCAELGKVAPQARIGNGVGQIAHVDFAGHENSFWKAGARMATCCWKRIGEAEVPAAIRVDGSGENRCSALRGMLHAGLQPALRDCKDAGGFARSEGLVKTENSTIAVVALGARDGEGGAEAAAVGLMDRGRNDKFAH